MRGERIQIPQSLVALWFFRGSGPVLHRNTILLWFFRVVLPLDPRMVIQEIEINNIFERKMVSHFFAYVCSGCSQENRLHDAALLSIHNIIWLRNKKVIFEYALLPRCLDGSTPICPIPHRIPSQIGLNLVNNTMKWFFLLFLWPDLDSPTEVTQKILQCITLYSQIPERILLLSIETNLHIWFCTKSNRICRFDSSLVATFCQLLTALRNICESGPNKLPQVILLRMCFLIPFVSYCLAPECPLVGSTLYVLTKSSARSRDCVVCLLRVFIFDDWWVQP